uniref:FAD synthase n=1 Tax=Stomoxys calcitrans TaxID=35570 RepID=A0A1I8PUZ6_STOCA
MEVKVNTANISSTNKLKDKKYSDYNEVTQKVHDQVNTLIESLHEIFQLYKPNEVMLSFNGGKDCTVVLHLLHTFYQSNPCLQHIKIPTLYITDPDAFEEVEDFVVDCEKLFNIDVIRKPGPIKEALEAICQERPHIKAVFMGCRRTDPYCQNLKVMQPTDAGWPPLMRINPILDWTCRDVWQYIYLYNVPYCNLYQKGYTSIGNKTNTLPNPYLRVLDEKTGAILSYRPGHELIDNDDLERAGRMTAKKEHITTNLVSK